MTTPSNPFGGSNTAPLPGGGGTYLDAAPDKSPSRHIVMIEQLKYMPPGFKATKGATIADFQILVTDAPGNHKVGATYGVYRGFDNILGKGNAKVDLAGYRTVVLQRPVTPAEITEEMLATGYNVQGFPLEVHDPEVFKATVGLGYRGAVLVAVCYKRPGKDFTHITWLPLSEQDERNARAAHPQMFEAAAG